MKNALLLITATMLSGVGCIMAADAMTPIYFDTAVYADKEHLDRGRLDVFVQTVYDDLQFIKKDSIFEAAFEISAIIFKGDDQIDGKTWKETVSVNSYEQTNSRSDVRLSRNYFELEPGNYKISITFEDLSTRTTSSIEEKIKVDNWSTSELSLAGVTYARRVEIENGVIRSIQPDVTSPTKGLQSPSSAYFEIYSKLPGASAEITYRIEGENSEYKLEKKLLVPLMDERTGVAIDLPVDSLTHDSFRLQIDVKADGKSARLEDKFYIRLPGLPRSTKDLHTAIQQLQLIASNVEWKKLKKTSKEKQREEFLQFWAKRDPSPGTDYNEAMESYYTLVNVANGTFGVMGREGWKTDRGMVFIILGPPDEIIRNDYPSGSKPYQIWQYYAINRQFEFYDRSGFGDYEFTYPVSIYEIQRYAKY
ncbi:MAG: GWxTD domain-containing protein [Calditrichaeota bacterium]|nr:MAG: GWxTD domain-containing protein [Calditrichota bacterium]